MEAKQKLINVPLSRKRSVPNPDSKSEETKQAGSSTWWLPLYLVFAAEIILHQLFFQHSRSTGVNRWINHAHDIINALPLAARQGTGEREERVDTPVPKSSLQHRGFPQKRPVPRLPVDCNGTLRSVPWNPLRAEAFGLEAAAAVRQEAVRARAADEEGALGGRRGIQVIVIALLKEITYM